MVPEVGWMRRMMARPMVVLPLPLSPTRPTVWPFLDLERNVVDGFYFAGLVAEDAAQDGEVDFEVIDAEEGGRHNQISKFSKLLNYRMVLRKDSLKNLVIWLIWKFGRAFHLMPA
jgi:hypothetical protein